MDEANRMIEQGVEILKLNIGNPAPFGFKAPQELVDMMRGNLENAEGYSDSRGLLKSRQAIVEYCKKKNIPNVGVNDIYTGNGVSELITLSMNGLLDNGDEVLVPSPDYPLWTASVTLAGGKAVHYLCDEQSNWYPDIADMRKKITDKTKGIVIINPNNPTGALYPKEILEQIVELAREHELLIFADEIYDRLVMDGKQHISIASLAPDLCVVSFNGLSKSHLIAGYRCGWMCISGDKSRAKGYIEGINLLSSMRLCANVPTQSVIPKALEMLDSTKEMLEPGGRVYEQREYIYNALNDIPGVSAVKPEAAFYIFPKMDMKKRASPQDGLSKSSRMADLKMEKTEMNMPSHSRWQTVALSTLHCGAGCTLADIIGEWFTFFVPLSIGGSFIAGQWTLDYLLALIIGVFFQYAAIRPMEHLSRRATIGKAFKIDFLSLTSWQIGMYGWMAVVMFVMYRGMPFPRNSWEFWFMMQIAMCCGFLTSYPINWILVKSGIKKGM